MIGEDYVVRLQVDGKGHCTLSKDGKTGVELAGCPREQGCVYLSVESDGRRRISELVIEGALIEGSRNAMVLSKAKNLAVRLRRP